MLSTFSALHPEADLKVAIKVTQKDLEALFQKETKKLINSAYKNGVRDGLLKGKKEIKKEWTKGYRACLKDKTIFENEAVLRKKANL